MTNHDVTVRSGLLKRFLVFLFGLMSYCVSSQPIEQSESEILLFRAISDGDSSQVEQLLQQGVSANCQYFNNITALGYAACKGRLGIVQVLVKHGAKVNTIIPLFLLPRTALGIAVTQKNLELTKFLISKGADIEVEMPKDGFFGFGSPDKLYYSAVTQAVMANNAEALSYLVSFKPEINRPSFGMEGFGSFGKTPLMIAANYDYEAIALILLRAGAKVNEPGFISDPRGALSSPLMEAARSGNTRLADTLINRGADVNAQDVFQTTALIAAGSRSDTRMAELLLNRGANLNAVTTAGFNCLLASIGLHRDYIITMLSNRAASVDQIYQIKGILAARQNWKKPDSLVSVSELDFSIIESDLERLLLGKDKATERVAEYNRAGLIVQHHIQNLEFTRYILGKGINVQQKTSTNQTAIQLAQKLNMWQTMEVLLDAGADEASVPPVFLMKMAIDTRNTIKLDNYLKTYKANLKGTEPCDLVFRALCRNNTSALRLLYNKGISPDCADSLSTTPLHSAMLLHNESLTDTLLAMGAKKTRADKHHVQPFHLANFLNKRKLAQTVKPDSLYVLTAFEVANSLAEAELKNARILGTGVDRSASNGKIFAYCGAIEKHAELRSPLLMWLTQPYEDSIARKYIHALFSRPILVLNPNGNSLLAFEQHQRYKSFPEMKFSGSAEYQNGRNNSKSAIFSGAFRVKTKEDTEESWDASASSMIEIVGTSTTWFNERAFWVGTSAFAGAGGGWNNHCITMVNGRCYGFKKADPTTARASYAIKGEYTIPKTSLLNSKYHAAFPGVKIVNEPDCIALKVMQNGQEKIVQPGKTMTFDRNKGDIIIIDEWSDKVNASGKGGDGRVKRSVFTVLFPGTYEISYNAMKEASFNERVKTYTDIYTYRCWIDQKTDSLSPVELSSLSALIHLLSEKANNAYKNVIKAELIGIVDFFENTQLKTLNDALLELADANTVEKPEIINRLDAILMSPKTDSLTRIAVTKIRSQVNNLSVNEAQEKLKEYKTDYLARFYKKVDAYNLLLLEYCLYIPTEKVQQQLILDRIPVYNEHLQPAAKERLKL